MNYEQRMIQISMSRNTIVWCDGDIINFILAAKTLNMVCEYCVTPDGYDFRAWYEDDNDDTREAKIKL